MENIQIQKVTIADVSLLKTISEQTFIETFSSDNTAENMDCYLSEAFSNMKLESELNNNDSEFYFAVTEGQVTGYLKINFGEAQSDLKDDRSLEIERIYVLKEFKGKRIGSSLFDKAVQRARESKLDYIWLGVWEHNLNALSFYEKIGFREFGRHLFILGTDRQTDIMMRLDLSSS
jgi:diamine N-acetyltransferase